MDSKECQELFLTSTVSTKQQYYKQHITTRCTQQNATGAELVPATKRHRRTARRYYSGKHRLETQNVSRTKLGKAPKARVFSTRTVAHDFFLTRRVVLFLGGTSLLVVPSAGFTRGVVKCREASRKVVVFEKVTL